MFNWLRCKCPQHTWHLSPTGAVLPQQHNTAHGVPISEGKYQEPEWATQELFLYWIMRLLLCLFVALCGCVSSLATQQIKTFLIAHAFLLCCGHCYVQHANFSIGKKMVQVEIQNKTCQRRSSVFPLLRDKRTDQDHYAGWMKRQSRRYRLRLLPCLWGGVAIHCFFLDMN